VDLTQSVFYRGLNFNSVDTLPGDGKRAGCLLEEADYGDVPGIGYKEKRAQDDGFDATEVFLGLRTVRLTGFVYGENKGDLWDRWQDIRSALTPSAAYLDAPGLDGFLPFQFYVPTLRLAEFPTGYRQLELRARPAGQPHFTVRRDTGTGGVDNGQALAWTGVLECKDPRFYVWPQKVNTFSASESGNLVNRGDYPAPLSLTFRVHGGSTAGNILFEVGGSRMRITVPDTGTIQTLRYDGNLKVLTLEENDVEVLRMDLLTFLSNTTHPKVPSGTSAYTITVSAGLTDFDAGYMFYSEAFA